MRNSYLQTLIQNIYYLDSALFYIPPQHAASDAPPQGDGSQLFRPRRQNIKNPWPQILGLAVPINDHRGDLLALPTSDALGSVPSVRLPTNDQLCSSSRGTALATNSSSLAPAHDSSKPQRVAAMFHRQFSSTSPRTVFRPPLLLSSGSHRNRLFTRMYTCTSGLHYRPRPSTHGRNESSSKSEPTTPSLGPLRKRIRPALP